ncbi:hypothetical protein KC980_02215 [candidate division WWE3 bacterium]|uniref:Uncharacterized protein n=1 Tax=candidate division WWE3 bacterium TaxID=2053526 RepID=A0A955EDT1_UNCKA|nr:hypothetical protein [candidate division WWE3 bacterium]
MWSLLDSYGDFIDSNLLNLSSYADLKLYKEKKFVFVPIGIFVAMISFAIAGFKAMISGYGFVEFRISLRRAGFYAIALPFFLAYMFAATSIADFVTTEMARLTFGDEYVGYVHSYYGDRVERARSSGGSHAELTRLEEEQKQVAEGNRLSFLVIFNAMMSNNLEELSGLWKSLFALAYAVVSTILLIFGLIRSYLLMFFVLGSPILFGLQILPEGERIDPFKWITFICMQHIALVMLILITYLSAVFADTNSLIGALMPMVAVVAAVYVSRQLHEIVGSENFVGYSTGIKNLDRAKKMAEYTASGGNHVGNAVSSRMSGRTRRTVDAVRKIENPQTPQEQASFDNLYTIPMTYSDSWNNPTPPHYKMPKPKSIVESPKTTSSKKKKGDIEKQIDSIEEKVKAVESDNAEKKRNENEKNATNRNFDMQFRKDKS